MSDHSIDKNYSDILRQVGIADPVHADTLNPMFKQLINNDANLKDQIMHEAIKKDYPFFVTGFNGHNGEMLDMYLSYKDDEFIPINGRGIEELGFVRDPSPLFRNGKFFITFTGRPGFHIAESDDLVNFTRQNIMLASWTGVEEGLTAPQFFVDDDNTVYIIGSHTTGIKDGNGYTIYNPRIVKALDETMLNWGNEIVIRLNDTPANTLDGCLFKENGVYHLWLKIEPQGVDIAYYTCATLDGIFQRQGTVNFQRPVEGMSVVEGDGKYLMYADIMSEGRSVVRESNDLLTWTNERPVMSTDGARTQHFDLIKLDSESQKIVNQAIKKHNNENAGAKLSLNRYGNRKLKIAPYLEGTVFKPPIFNGTIYTLDDDDLDQLVISEVQVPNVRNHYDFYFLVTRGAGVQDRKTSGILLKQTQGTTIEGNGALSLPYYKDFLIDSQYRNVLIHMTYLGKDWTTKNNWVVEGVKVNYPFEVKNLKDLAVSGVIETLTPYDNTYYIHDETTPVTINNIKTDRLTDNGKFYFVIKQNKDQTNSKIIIKTQIDVNLNNFIGRNAQDTTLLDKDIYYEFVKEPNISTCRQVTSNSITEKPKQVMLLTPASSEVRYTSVVLPNGMTLVNLYFAIPASSISSTSTSLGTLPAGLAPPNWLQNALTIDGNINSSNLVLPFIQISNTGVMTLVLNTLTGKSGIIQGGFSYLR